MNRSKTFALFICLLVTSFCLLPDISPVLAQDERGKAEGLFKEALTLFQEGDIDKALTVAGESLKADAKFAEAYDLLGYILLSKHRNEEALHAFNTALNISPALRTSKTGRGLALLGKGDLTGAEAALKESLQLNPYPSMTYYALGVVYERQNDYVKAIENFKAGITKFKDGNR
jgi:tetratricopeptide (TPR) repeat protein